MSKLKSTPNRQGLPDFSGPQNGRRRLAAVAAPPEPPKMCGCVGCFNVLGYCSVKSYDESAR